MKGRRELLVTVMVVGLLLAVGVPGNAQEKVITWKLAGVWGPGDASYMPETLAKLINEKSGGRLKVVTYPSGQLYGAKELFGALQKGLIELCDIPTGWWGDTIPLYKLPDFPFFLRDNRELRSMMEGGLWDLWQKEADKVGFKVLAAYGWSGLQCFSIRPVRTLEDVQGRKWRIHTPPLGQAVKNLGASPVTIGIPETYQAFERGVIDAGFMGVTWAYSFKWHEVAKYITKVDLGVPAQSFFANKKALDALPPDLKDVVIKAGQEAQNISWGAIDGFVNKKWESFKEEKCTLYTLPENERNKWIAQAQAKQIWDEESKKIGPVGPEAMAVYYKVFPDRKPR